MGIEQRLLSPQRWEELPGDWEGVFGRRAPLAVEIGFGNGEFLAKVAEEQPGWDFVGFEVASRCLWRANLRLWRAGVGNVRLVQVDGAFALRELFPDESLTRVYAHFPCPWPKARHARRRLVDEEFARTLAAVLSPDGAFELTTDAPWYAEEAAGKLSQGGWFRLTGPRPLEGGPGTRYERKWREQGRGIWHLSAEKVAGAKVERIAEGEMPHARIPVSVTRETEAPVGLKEVWPGGAFVIKEAFFTPEGSPALLRVFSTDQDFRQHYFLAVVPEQTGAMVKLDEATVPFRTPAVKRSVVAVAAALERRAPRR